MHPLYRRINYIVASIYSVYVDNTFKSEEWWQERFSLVHTHPYFHVSKSCIHLITIHPILLQTPAVYVLISCQTRAHKTGNPRRRNFRLLRVYNSCGSIQRIRLNTKAMQLCVVFPVEFLNPNGTFFYDAF